MSVAAISANIGQFFSGAVDPSTPHLALILAAVIGGLAVGIGIIWEAARGGHLWTLPTAFVFFGIVIEAAATVTLFEFDEGITHAQQRTIGAQQSQIISLTREAGPRNIHLPSDRREFVKVLSPFRGTPYDLTIPPITSRSPGALYLLELEPGSFLVEHLIALLNSAGWKLQSVEGDVPKTVLPAGLAGLAMPHPKSGAILPIIEIGRLSGISGILISAPVDNEKLTKAAVKLATFLNTINIWSDIDPGPPNNDISATAITGNAVHIVIGPKP